MQGFTSEKYGFGYKFIPKVACTSIKNALIKAEGMVSSNRLGVVKKIKKKPWGISNIRVRRLKPNAHKVVNRSFLNDLDDYQQRFLVVRDPVKRFISAYRNRVGEHRALSEENIKWKNPELYTNFPSFRPSLSEFIQNFDTYEKVHQIKHHTKPFAEFLDGMDLSYFTDVYPLEDLGSFEERLSNIYGTQVSFPKMQTKGFNVGLKDLSRSELDKVINLYDKDYELLKDYYKPEDIISEWERYS